jgi:plastocyanin
MRAFAVTVAVLLVLAVPAAADQQIQAAPTKKYSTPSVTIAQGEKLTFHNGDAIVHDVTSAQDLDGKPLFSTPLVDPGGDAVVEGAQYLTTGEYAFYCSVHPEMQGKLTVTSAGTPVPRPGSGGGGATLKAAGAKLSSVRRGGKLAVRVSGPAGATAIVAAEARLHGKRVKLGRARATLASADAQKITLKLTSKARKALKGVRKVAVTFKATVLAPSGPLTASAKRTYR